ncbi:hypothetical protein MNBD_GAMMA14-1423 [hydrothermal vent metagenome]|uniref:Toxin CptA n=1 Tax=hydrothermal vent metagenome TaxID=652676 RepID=A0A3B0YEB0_9ZZZZ
MWNRFDHPLRLELGHSPLLLKVLMSLHLAAISAWATVPLSPVLRLSVVLVLLIQFWHLQRVYVRPVASRAVRALYWESETGWHVKTARGWFPATLCHPYYVTARLVAVRFRIGRLRRVTAIVVGDRTGADSFRRLRVRLLQCSHRDNHR